MSPAVEQPVTLSRRQLLFGRAKQLADRIYPPWASAGISRCTGCGDCAVSCPQGIIKMDETRQPVVDFQKNECNFCQRCATACREDIYDLNAPAWAVEVEIGEGCFVKRGVYCRTCGDNCPEAAIRFALRPGNQTEIILDSNACTGCGACVSGCPVSAVQIVPAATTKTIIRETTE